MSAVPVHFEPGEVVVDLEIRALADAVGRLTAEVNRLERLAAELGLTAGDKPATVLRVVR